VPIYEYACKSCNHRLDALQKMSDDPLKECPECGEVSLKRLISAPRFRLKGKGQPGYGGGPAGDALIQITVTPDPVFSRDGLNINLTLPITLYEAALGGKVEVPTLHGMVGLKLPKGSKTDQTMRLKGRGIEMRSGKKGDQMVTLSVQMPDEIDDDLAAFLEGWKEDHGYDPRQKLKSTSYA